MKIDPNEKVRQNNIAPTPRPPAGPQGSSFAGILENTVKASQPGRTDAPSAVRSVILPPMTTALSEVYGATESLLKAMGHYRQLLGDHKATLRAVEPAVRRMQAKVDTLGQLVAGMCTDHPLKKVAVDALTAASKEVARFDGGYYLEDG